MQRVPDPYRILGIGREATTAEVRAAHRRLAKRLHPDAPHADAARFLAVQDAYELLRDPLRRREWDRRHAQGPVRAEPSSAESRRRRTSTTDGPSDPVTPASPRSRRRKPMGTDATFGPNDRPPQEDSWTWTAEGVPWWEDGGAPRTRRSTRRRPTAAAAGGPAAAAGDARGAADPADPGTTGRRPTSAPEPAAAETRNDFDVYARSSGAAWSSASRAYFRRRAADMPSGAANPNTPRWTTPVGAPTPHRYEASAPPAAEGPRPATSPVGAEPRTARPGPSPTPSQPGVASRGLGAALTALFRRGDR